MPPAVSGVDIVVVVLPVAGACIVRRVDIDTVDARWVQPFEELERVVIFGLDQDVVRVIAAAAANDFDGLQCWKNRLAKTLNDGQIFDRDRLRITAAFRLTKSGPVREPPYDEGGVDPAVAAGDPAAASRAGAVNRGEAQEGDVRIRARTSFPSVGPRFRHEDGGEG